MVVENRIMFTSDEYILGNHDDEIVSNLIY